jgi:S-DNA-T family DNA segregation ATPase FtsK/SpoIIIE
VIAGLAISAAPDRTTFLLIDYKGGAAFGPLAELPHTTGLITDLDFSLAARALISLRAELRRREHLLAQHRVADLAGLRDRRAALPSLVIVVDEFATVAAEQPDFLAGLLDIAQRGRSLGLHLILATQRPAGVISPAMKANIGLRICLRVTDDADSVDVVDSSRAARLPFDVPGRAVLRFSRSRNILFQVARVSAAPAGGHRVRLRTSGVETPPGCGPAVEAGPSDLDEVVASARLAAAGIEAPRPPWLPPLPSVYTTADPVLIGLLDRPAEQSQVSWPAPSGSVMLLGSPASGRSSALRRFGWTAAAAGAELLVIDPGQGLRDVAAWPAVRTHLDGQDPLLVQRLVGRLADELRFRSTTPGHPALLLVDGWEVLSKPLDALDYGSTMSKIADLAVRGPAAGITVVISGELQLQHHRIATSFTTTVRLGVDERGRPVPNGLIAGRGRLGADEIQIARCDRGVRPPPATSQGASLPAAIVVRALPETIERRHLPPASPDAVPIGVGGDDASPQFIDLSGPGGGLLISGPRRSGVSTALSVLAGGAAEAGIRVVRGCLQPLAALSGVRDVDVRAGAADLRTLLAEHHGPILLIADCVDGWSAAGMELLERFTSVAGAAQYLAIGCRLDRALRAHRGVVTEVAASRTGILLQADSADGALLDAAIPRRRRQDGPGRGHLVLAGRVVPLQVATLGPGHPA